MTREEWIAAFAAELGVEAPAPAQIESLLKLASVAAHSSERPAAPLACWVAGCAGADPPTFMAAAERVNQIAAAQTGAPAPGEDPPPS